LRFADLYSRAGLERVDAYFVDALRAFDAALAERFLAARAAPASLPYKEEADLLIEVAPALDEFVAELFGIESEWQALVDAHHRLAPLFRVKRKFVQRRAMLKIKADEAAKLDGPALEAEVARRIGGAFEELAFAEHILAWTADEAAHGEDLAAAERFAAWATHTPEGRRRYRDGVLFKPPQRVDPMNLVPTETKDSRGYSVHTLHHIRRREGFALTDPGTNLAGALDEANYCIWCHEQGKDSCSKGLKEKPDPTGKIHFKKSPFGVPLAGCPLEERISEFHKLKSEGWAIGALATIVIDNPTVCATGHRICNDCMKSCIYQRQDPVDIPQAETRTLKDVLGLPWGFEIYSLLTRWNPLNLRRPLPLAHTGKRVLIVGMGPAGFTLAHHLMNDGHAVVGIDGLKIEPLDADVSGVKQDGTRVPFRPIRDIAELREPLESRAMAGFGGVAEYGITVRWDKNFLKMARLLVERRAEFAMFGGVRFGGTLTVETAFAMGFDHVALCLGAGKPTVLEMPNGLARGVRTASDFLMALQLTGAAKTDSIANLQGPPADRRHRRRAHRDRHGDGIPRLLPAAGREIPGALRAARGAVERGTCAQRVERRGNRGCRGIPHARARDPRRARGRGARRARAAHPRAVAAVGRRHDRVSQAARRQSLVHAQPRGSREGARGRHPVRREPHARSASTWTAMDMCARWWPRHVLRTRRERRRTRSRASRAHAPHRRGHAAEYGARPGGCRAFRARRTLLPRHRRGRKPGLAGALGKAGCRPVLATRDDEGRFTSFFGDLHPSFFGNVVKAMGSAKQGYPVVSRVLAKRPARRLRPRSNSSQS
jgi:hypothetical protein